MKEDIIGQTFKNLTVLGIDVEKTNEKKCTYVFCKCSCGNILSVTKKGLLNKKTNACNSRCPNNYYYKVGEIVNDLKIIELLQDRGKKYKVKCIKDDYEFVIAEYHLRNLKGCPVCCNRVCIKGVNDVATTHPHLVKYFANPEDSTKVTYGSSKKCLMRCPNCGFEKWMVISELSRRGFSCKQCSDNISYPEKFVFNFIKQLNVDFKTQASCTYFNWLSCNKKYDFYLINYNCIIETHGNQHYERGFNDIGGRTRTLEEEQENDRFKRELALANGITHYIELDCRESKLDWIKNSILQSKLPNLLNFKETDIDWNKCDEMALKSYVPLAWEYYDNNKYKMSFKNMADFFNVKPDTFRNWLKVGVKAGKCTYEVGYNKNYNENKKGVRFCEIRNRWESSFYINGKVLKKYFLAKEEAIEQRIKWENGDFTKSKKLITTNTSGVTGVCYGKGSWVAYITINKEKRRKTFKTKEEAIQQRLTWEKERDELYAQQKASNENI